MDVEDALTLVNLGTGQENDNVILHIRISIFFKRRVTKYSLSIVGQYKKTYFLYSFGNLTVWFCLILKYNRPITYYKFPLIDCNIIIKKVHSNVLWELFLWNISIRGESSV